MKIQIEDYVREMRMGKTCANCGSTKQEWRGNGYYKNGIVFCCAGCAGGTDCTCDGVMELKAAG